MTGRPPGARRLDPVVRWRRDLERWAIPPELLAVAVEPPWALGERSFQDRARAAAEQARRSDDGQDRSRTAALEGLAATPAGAGSVLDVGAGGGAAGLALASRMTRLTAVDPNATLLASLRDEARRLDLRVSVVEGRWPQSADRIGTHDVVVCHHVLYDVPDAVPFVRALTDHAASLVVLEISQHHPLAWTNPLWLRFHGIRRPEGPTADDALAMIHSLGMRPEAEVWERPVTSPSVELAAARARRNLCLPPEREPEVADAVRQLIAGGALPGGPALDVWPVMTIRWAGTGAGPGPARDLPHRSS